MRSTNLPARLGLLLLLALGGLLSAAAQESPPTPAAKAAPTAEADAPAPMPDGEALMGGSMALPDYAPPDVSGTLPSPGAMLARTLGSLVLVVGLIGAAGWLVKLRGGMITVGRHQRLRLLETLTLGPSRQVYLVAAGSKVLLIGSGGGQLAVLDRINPDDVGFAPSEGVDAVPGGSAPVEGFLAKLQSMQTKSGGFVPPAA